MKALIGFLGVAALAALGQAAGAQVSSTSVDGGVGPARSSPAATATLTALQQVCLPLLQGQSIKAISASAGLKKNDRQWVMKDAAGRKVEIDPPDSANPHVCSAVIPHRPGSSPAILAAVDGWAKSQAPPLQPDKVRVQSTQDSEAVTTSSWIGQAPGGAEGLVLVDKQPVAGQTAGGLDEATLLISLTPS